MIDPLLGFAKCFGARERHEIYLSAPITTGLAYISWRHSQGSAMSEDHPRYQALHNEYVVSVNLTRIAPLVGQLRKRFADRLIIDPTSFPSPPEWGQEDYHLLWSNFIRKYAALVIFADGWQYSTGCVREFDTAVRADIKMVDQSLKPISRRDGERLVADAIGEFEKLKVDSTDLRQALNSAISG